MNTAQHSTIFFLWQAFADRVAGVFVPAVLLLALTTFVAWYALLKAGVVPQDWKTEG